MFRGYKRKRSSWKVGRPSKIRRRSVLGKFKKGKGGYQRFGSLRGPRMQASSTSIARGMGPTDRLYVKLHYSQFVTFGSVAGLTVGTIFRGNSIFDPDLSGTGTQPLFFDQYASLYRYYCVLGSSIKAHLTLGDISTVAKGTADFAIVPTSVSTSFSGASADEVMQQQYVKHTVIALQQQGPVPVLRHYASTDKMFGNRNGTADMSDANYGALVTQNPGSAWFWHVVMWPHDRAATVTNYIQVDITYYVVFTAPQRVATS